MKPRYSDIGWFAYSCLVGCPFCESSDRVVAETPLVRVLLDLFPITPGHLLVIPRRHIPQWSDATADERAAILGEIDRARELALSRDRSIAGFNIGWNDGVAAGQTVMHLHVHVIPRRHGDVVDPRGGIRWIIPERARYWSEE